jgi:hypothetical protein
MTSINDYYYILPENINLSANADNLEINSNYVHLIPAVDIDVTGFQSPTSEDHSSLLVIENDTALGSGIDITLKHLSGSSSAGNQLYLGGSDIVLAPQQYAFFRKVGKGYILSGIA